MFKAAIFAGALLFSGGAGTVVAQTTGSDPWDSIIGSAIGSSGSAAILAWWLREERHENKALRSELKDLHEKDSARGERIAVALENATSVLRDVQRGMGATIARSHPEDISRVVHQLETVVDDLTRRGGRP